MTFYVGIDRSENSRDTEMRTRERNGNVHHTGLRDKIRVKVAKSALFVQRLRSQQRMGSSAGDREVNLDISHEVQ